jgi:hypothetical protein
MPPRVTDGVVPSDICWCIATACALEYPQNDLRCLDSDQLHKMGGSSNLHVNHDHSGTTHREGAPRGGRERNVTCQYGSKQSGGGCNSRFVYWAHSVMARLWFVCCLCVQGMDALQPFMEQAEGAQKLSKLYMQRCVHLSTELAHPLTCIAHWQ